MHFWNDNLRQKAFFLHSILMINLWKNQLQLNHLTATVACHVWTTGEVFCCAQYVSYGNSMHPWMHVGFDWFGGGKCNVEHKCDGHLWGQEDQGFPDDKTTDNITHPRNGVNLSIVSRCADYECYCLLAYSPYQLLSSPAYTVHGYIFAALVRSYPWW